MSCNSLQLGTHVFQMFISDLSGSMHTLSDTVSVALIWVSDMFSSMNHVVFRDVSSITLSKMRNIFVVSLILL